MNLPKMNHEQLDYLKSELFSLTLMGTVQRGSLYQEGSSEAQRSAFRRSLRAELEQLSEEYSEPVSEARHLANITSLAELISAKHPEVLSGRRFRIGSAQKALNLYLKYMWCLGLIPIPPHCPFDAIVLSQIPECRHVRWTQLDSPDDYKQIVKRAKAVAGTIPLATWELRIYNRAEG